jgi:excisionase family DNA binding protein
VPKNKSQLLLNSVNGSGRRYATIRETAAHIRVGERTVRLMIEDGRLRAYRLGPRIVRLDLNEVDAAMESGAQR